MTIRVHRWWKGGRGVHLPDPELLFARFTQGAKTVDGARAEFELFILDLVDIQMPNANTVRGKGGNDWGIDVLVGSFSNGRLAIWQCKFVETWKDSTPQKQVRASMKSLTERAKANGLTIGSWTLCVPCILAPEEQLWFDRWAKRQQRDHKIAKVEMWNGAALRKRLLVDDAMRVRREYFPDTVPATVWAGATAAITAAAATTEQVADVSVLDDPAQFDDALFVRQLREAGEIETDPARGLFYATDALVRDYAARGDRAAIQALNELHLTVHQIWSGQFNAASGTADGDGRMTGLHQAVMSVAGDAKDPVGLRLRPVHRMGAVHRLVEEGSAGWVTQWRAVRDHHRSLSEMVAEPETDPPAGAGPAVAADSAFVAAAADAAPAVATAAGGHRHPATQVSSHRETPWAGADDDREEVSADD